MKRVTLLLLILGLVFGGCSKRTDVPTAPGGLTTNSNGNANFSMYVAIGNSLTAGMQSSALYESAQQYSFPKQIAQQAGVTTFEQPIISDPGIGGRIRITSIAPSLTLVTDGSTGTPTNLTLARPYNNLGVPGAILYDMMDTSSFSAKAGAPRGNPFFQIVLRNPALGKSIIDQASALSPTMITFWIGANDVLGYATSGGTLGSDPTGTQPTPGTLFDLLYKGAIAKLKAQNPNAQIVVANIPDVIAIPFFTTVPTSFTNPANGQQVPFMITTKSGVRQAGAGDYILLTASTFLTPDLIIQGHGTVVPIPDALVLDRDEVAVVEAALTSFNATIANVAAQYGFALVDMHAFLNLVNTSGVTFGGETFTSKFVTGGIFSFDGVHPSNRGYALIANEFLKVINVKYNANIRLVDVMSASGISLGKKSVSDGIEIPYYAIPPEAAQAIPKLILGR